MPKLSFINTIKKIKDKIKKIDPKKINIFFTILEFTLVLIISILYYLNLPVKSKQVIFIPKGNTKDIISYLDKKNHNLNYIDYIITKKIGYPQYGWIDLKKTTMTKFDYLYRICTSKAALRKIQLTPGETSYFFLKMLSKKLKLNENIVFKEFNKQSYKKDGTILAETYILPIGMKESDLISYLLKFTDLKYKKYAIKIFGVYNKKRWYRYIIVASIIQKEAANKEEMPLISSVIYNRLRKKLPLQMDGTLNYGKNSHTKITPKIIKNDNSSYNTYKHKGLPTDPICAVEIESIKAAIFPAKTPYLYFVKNPETNKHIFTTNYKEHIRNIRYFRKIKKKLAKTKKFKNNKNRKTNIKKTHIKKYKVYTKPIDIKSLW